MAITKIFYHTDFENHIPTLNNPECSKRVTNIINLIKEENFANISFVEPNKIKKELIYAAHDKNFVDETLNKFPENDEIVYLDQETPVSQGSKDATLRAAGAGIDAVESILDGSCKNAFCIVRPPGHHACIDRSMGFCVFNNVAVAAHYLINKYSFSNIAIIDFDVHHGNGTQDIFYDNEKVLYISTHQYPYYPGSGTKDEKGKHNNILNIPLPAGTTSEEYLNAYEFVLNKIKEFKPEFILLSAGFDAHKDDPLAQLQLESKDFYNITKRTLELSKQYCDGKVVSILEGGYDLQALQESTEMHVKALLEFN